MRGELIGVWTETRREIWEPLADVEGAPDDIYCELYREIAVALVNKLSLEELANVIDSPVQAKEAFLNIKAQDLLGEGALARFFEKTLEALEELAGTLLADAYFKLLSEFVQKYSLRYDVIRPCLLCPSLSGVFASLVRDLKEIARHSPYLAGLMRDFENSMQALRVDCSDGQIRICMAKQMNLLEALGSQHPQVRANTVGAICNEIGTWPHESVKDAIKNLYKFTCNYPGIRHAGTPSSAIRPIEMRDMVAVSILLAGFTPYLTDQLNADAVYRGT